MQHCALPSFESWTPSDILRTQTQHLVEPIANFTKNFHYSQRCFIQRLVAQQVALTPLPIQPRRLAFPTLVLTGVGDIWVVTTERSQYCNGDTHGGCPQDTMWARGGKRAPLRGVKRSHVARTDVRHALHQLPLKRRYVLLDLAVKHRRNSASGISAGT